MKQIIREKNLQKYVSFEGIISHDQLKFYYNLADIFVIPSYTEGGPNVIQEAVTCNTPCIGTDVGFIPEVLSNDVGIIVPKKDDLKLFESIKLVLDGNFEVNQIKRKKLVKEWSLKIYGQKLKEIIDNSQY